MYERTKATLSILGLLIAAVAAFPSLVSAAHAPTLTLTTDTTLTADVTGHIVIGADGITLDCAGFSVIGDFSGIGAGSGVFLGGRSGVTVRNCHAEGFQDGFLISSSSGNTLTGNSASRNAIGFYLFTSSSGNTLTGNAASDNSLGFAFLRSPANALNGNVASANSIGYLVELSEANVLVGNTAVGGTLGFAIDQSSHGTILTGNTATDYSKFGFRLSTSDGNTLTGNAAESSGIAEGFFLLGSDLNTITGNFAEGNVKGFHLSSSTDNTLTGNVAVGNGEGFRTDAGARNTLTGNTATGGSFSFFLFRSTRSTLTGNVATGNLVGFRVSGSSGVTLIGNVAEGVVRGFRLDASVDNTLTGNTATGYARGVEIDRSSRNILEENTVTGNGIGFLLIASFGATIFHNNIIANVVQASDDNPAANDWHDPVLEEGNFWSDYTGVDDGSGTGKHAIAGDGIGDTLIPHPGPDFDNFPFTSPFPQPIAVDIDIKPGSDPGSINMKSKGKTTVAILSTPDFDATAQVERSSLTFGSTGDEQSLAKCTTNEDVNGDGLLDLVCQFNTQDTAFQDGDTEGILRGQTFVGTPIEGSDSVRILHG